MTGYVKHFDSNKTISFKVSDNKLLRNYNKIWERVWNLLSTKFDNKPVYGDNDKRIKTKIKLYGDKTNTNFQGKKIPKENASYNCLLLIMFDSVIKANKKYYPQPLLEECKHEIKNNKMENLLMMICIQVHQMNLIVNLIMNLIMDLMMRLIINFDNDENYYCVLIIRIIIKT